MPWWIWALGVLLGLFLLVWSARRSFRRAVRGEFVAFLRDTRPEVTVTAEQEDALTLEIGGHSGTRYLHKLYAAAAASPSTAEARREVFLQFADSLLSGQAAADATLSLETHGDRILPRLMQALASWIGHSR